ncbi:MAG: hypothetical protein ACYCZF_09060 [Anaerolineae bacterium]
MFLRLVTMNRLGITGDEPHYLVITYSLLHDGDFDLRNNYLQHDADAWYPGLQVETHAFDYKGNGKLYSVHGIGLGIIMVPAMILVPNNLVLAGRLLLVLITAFTTQQTFLLCLDLFRRKWLAWFSLILMLCCVPVLWMSNQIYPDVPAALLTIIAARTLYKLPQRRAALILGLALALMPWFHIRYIPIAVIMGLFGLVRIALTGNRRVLFILVTPLLLSAIMFIKVYVHFYGNPLANAQYTSSYWPYSSSSISRFLKMLAIVTWDREFGMIPIAPVFLIAFTGIFLIILRRNIFFKCLLISFMVYFLALVYTLSFEGGGSFGFSFPWRFIFPVLPLLVLFISYAIDSIQPLVYLAIPLVIASLAICLLAARSPAVFYPTETGILPVNGLNRIQHLLPSMYYASQRSIAATRGAVSTGQVTTEGGEKVVCARQGEDQPGMLSWGIRGGVMPGEFQATFSIMAQTAAETDVVAIISLLDNTTLRTIISKELVGADFPKPGSFEPFILSTKTDRANVVGSLVQYAGNGDVCLKEIAFKQVTSTYPASSPYLAVFASAGAVITSLIGGLSQRKKH